MLAVLFICLFTGVFSYDQITTTLTASSVYRHHDASLANDGDFSQIFLRCAHTDTKKGIKEAWLCLDLAKIHSIKSVKIWYRNDRDSYSRNTMRLRGYSIRVSNDSVLPPPESSCYTDPGNVTLPTVIERDCERTARYVWIYQDNTRDGDCPMLEICEVQLFGCETGKYGVNCSNTCDHCNNNETCAITSGECDGNGCVDDNLVPPLCYQCLHGLFGYNCTKHCSRQCKNDNCDRITGTCLSGCVSGYTGSFCNTSCPSGKYGIGCQETCNHCLQNTTCHHVTGICLSGCKEGYKGGLCNTACSLGEYGRNCEHHCGHCLNNEACSRFDGRCSACENGYQGFKCDKECSAGTYGGNCTEICGACLDDVTCHHVDGHCPSGCSPGWKSTPKCDAPCPPGTFGPNCINKCSGNCLHHATCDKGSGKCKSCSEGWKNDFCNEKSGKAITDLEKMTLEHLKLDNQRLVLESGMLKKESEKISSETSFLKLKEKYLRLKIQSEFPVFLRNDPTISLSEQKAGQNLGESADNVPTPRHNISLHNV